MQETTNSEDNDNDEWAWLDPDLPQFVACDGCGTTYSLDKAERINRRVKTAVSLVLHTGGWPRKVVCLYYNCPGHTGWMQINGRAHKAFQISRLLHPNELYRLTSYQRSVLIQSIRDDIDTGTHNDEALEGYKILLDALGDA